MVKVIRNFLSEKLKTRFFLIHTENRGYGFGYEKQFSFTMCVFQTYDGLVGPDKLRLISGKFLLLKLKKS